MWQYVRLRGDAAHHLLGARSGAHGCGMMKQPHTRGVRMPLIGGGGGKPPVVTYCDREYQLHARDTRVAAVVQTTGAMWAWGCVDHLVHHACTPLVDMPRMDITRVRGHHSCKWSRLITCVHHSSGMPYEYMYGTWTPEYVYVDSTCVRGHGTPCVFTTRRVCHTSTCTARGHPSTCTPLAHGVHVVHGDVQVRVCVNDTVHHACVGRHVGGRLRRRWL
jgi:hypothetical protein